MMPMKALGGSVILTASTLSVIGSADAVGTAKATVKTATGSFSC
jgi:hypothetical protein